MKTLTYYMEANEALDWALETMTGKIPCFANKRKKGTHTMTNKNIKNAAEDFSIFDTPTPRKTGTQCMKPIAQNKGL